PLLVRRSANLDPAQMRIPRLRGARTQFVRRPIAQLTPQVPLRLLKRDERRRDPRLHWAASFEAHNCHATAMHLAHLEALPRLRESHHVIRRKILGHSPGIRLRLEPQHPLGVIRLNRSSAVWAMLAWNL